MTLRLFTAALALAAIPLIGGCGENDVYPPYPQHQQDPSGGAALDDPGAVVEQFYAWYLDYAASDGDPLMERAYAGSEHLSPLAVERIDQFLVREGASAGEWDPFLCAEDRPAGVEVVAVEQDTPTRAEVTVTADGLDEPLTVHLIQAGGRWEITDVDCPGAMLDHALEGLEEPTIQSDEDVDDLLGIEIPEDPADLDLDDLPGDLDLDGLFEEDNDNDDAY